MAQKESFRTSEIASFNDGIEAASAKNQLSEAPAIERAVPGVEAFGLEAVFRSSHEGLRQMVFQSGLDLICQTQSTFKDVQAEPVKTLPESAI